MQSTCGLGLLQKTLLRAWFHLLSDPPTSHNLGADANAAHADRSITCSTSSAAKLSIARANSTASTTLNAGQVVPPAVPLAVLPSEHGVQTPADVTMPEPAEKSYDDPFEV